MHLYHLESSLWLPRPPEAVFGFFADARNLERLAPPWLRFRILTPTPITMQVGAQIAYRLKLRGVPLRWDSEIAAWEPPHRFVDVQRRGPYRRWVHEHRFAEHPGGTLVSDHVTYAVFGGHLVQWLLVGPDLRRIFAYRRARLAEALGPGAARTTSPLLTDQPRARNLAHEPGGRDALRPADDTIEQTVVRIAETPAASGPARPGSVGSSSSVTTEPPSQR
jgi:ligand-binding SRPBCC domain-containing protein